MRRALLLLQHVIGYTVADIEYRCAAIQDWVHATEQRLHPRLAHATEDD